MTAPGDDSGEGPTQSQIDRFLTSEARKAGRAYEKAVTRLWVGNAGGILATVSLFSEKSQVKPTWLVLIPLGFFLSGLVAMAYTTFYELLLRREIIRASEGKADWVNLPALLFRRPSDEIGLGRGVMTSMVLFLWGCLTGFLGLVWAVIHG